MPISRGESRGLGERFASREVFWAHMKAVLPEPPIESRRPDNGGRAVILAMRGWNVPGCPHESSDRFRASRRTGRYRRNRPFQTVTFEPGGKTARGLSGAARRQDGFSSEVPWRLSALCPARPICRERRRLPGIRSVSRSCNDPADRFRGLPRYRDVSPEFNVVDD